MAETVEIKAGELRHYVNVENPYVISQNSRGQVQTNWVTTYEKVPAKVETLSGIEEETARQYVPSAKVKITMRYVPQISNRSRIVWDGRYFNVESVNDVEQRRRKLIISATEDIKKTQDAAASGSGSGD